MQLVALQPSAYAADSSGQHQFTLTSVPPLLTCTEQSAMAGLATPMDITANVAAVATARANFFISTPQK
jgi:hypothetical protein